MKCQVSCVCLLIYSSAASYVPPYYEGTPTSLAVASLDPPDFSGKDSYRQAKANPVSYENVNSLFRIEFSLEAEAHMPQQGFVHRTWADFVEFDRLLTSHLLNFGLDFPLEADLTALDSYLQRVMAHERIVQSTVLSDFLGINWSGADLKFLQSIPDFMYIVIPPLYR